MVYFQQFIFIPTDGLDLAAKIFLRKWAWNVEFLYNAGKNVDDNLEKGCFAAENLLYSTEFVYPLT